MKALFYRYKNLIIYFLAAGSGVIVQYIVGSILLRYFNFGFQNAVLWGFIAAIPVGFILSKIFAFDSKSSGNTQREIIKFGLVTLISGLITVKGSYLILITLTHLFGNLTFTLPFFNYSFSPIGTFSHFAGMGLSFIFNFVTHKKFTFVETGIYDKMKSVRNQ